MRIRGPFTYADCERILGSRSDKKIGNNRFLRRMDVDCITLTLHGRSVITWEKDGKVTLFDCGYQTRTTEATINEYAPLIALKQRDGKWYYSFETWHYGLDSPHSPLVWRPWSTGLMYFPYVDPDKIDNGIPED